MKKILHLVCDNASQDYFLKYVSEERDMEKNDILFFKEGTESKRLKYYNKNSFTTVPKRNMIPFLNDFDGNKYDLVVIHNFYLNYTSFVLSLKKNVKLAWVFWGTDGYNDDIINVTLYGQETEKYTKSTGKCIIKKIKYALMRGIKFLGLLRYISKVSYHKHIINTVAHKRKAFERINFCMTHLKEDFLLLKKHNPSFTMEYCDFFYMPIAIHNELHKMQPGVVLLGNSSSITNNHLDTFKLINKSNFQFTKVICPLNYGGTKRYNRRIIKKGDLVFKNTKTEFIMNFMAKVKWESKLQEVSVVLFNHYRQQAMGNTIFLLLSGKRLYLNSRSTAFKHLKDLDCIVFDIEQDDIVKDILSRDERIQNAEVISRRYSKSRFKTNWNELVQLVDTNNA